MLSNAKTHVNIYWRFCPFSVPFWCDMFRGFVYYVISTRSTSRSLYELRNCFSQDSFDFYQRWNMTLEDSSFSIWMRYWNYLAIMVFYNSKYWVAIVYLVHFIINDLVIFLLSLTVDIFLVIRIRQALAKKKKLNLKTLKTSKSNLSQTTKNLNEIKKAYDDTNRMVLMSLGLYVVCRLPELAFKFISTSSTAQNQLESIPWCACSAAFVYSSKISHDSFICFPTVWMLFPTTNTTRTFV